MFNTFNLRTVQVDRKKQGDKEWMWEGVSPPY